MLSPMEWLGVDWGSSHRRAYLLGAGGGCLRRHEDERGMLTERGRFAWSLAALRHAIGARPGAPAVLSGMVGSAQGWHEVPYLENSVSLYDLPHHLVAVREMADCYIVPGYVRRGPVADVMRGEETQLLGALALKQGDGWFVLPGTHSKWVQVQDGRMMRWSTYMTGELFALLSRDGTLSLLLETDPTATAAAEAAQESGFAAGLALAARKLPLSQALFSVRAAVVSGAMPAAQTRGCVSGLLIGAEFAALGANGIDADAITIIAAPALASRYQRAAAAFGLPAATLDPHATYCAALGFIASRRSVHVG